MNELVTVRNTATGGVAKVRRNIAEHEYFGEILEIVPDGTKPRVPLSVLTGNTRPELLPDSLGEVEEYDDLEEEED